jgi:hypothetical protein
MKNENQVLFPITTDFQRVEEESTQFTETQLPRQAGLKFDQEYLTTSMHLQTTLLKVILL